MQTEQGAQIDPRTVNCNWSKQYSFSITITKLRSFTVAALCRRRDVINSRASPDRCRCEEAEVRRDRHEFPVAGARELCTSPRTLNNMLATAIFNLRQPSPRLDSSIFDPAVRASTPSAIRPKPPPAMARTLSDALRSLTCGMVKPRKRKAANLPVTLEPTFPEAWLTD